MADQHSTTNYLLVPSGMPYGSKYGACRHSIFRVALGDIIGYFSDAFAM